MKPEKKTPYISIIVPALYSPESARQCLDVILEQDHDSFEVVLATDSAYKCRHIDDPRVKLSKTSAGQLPNRLDLLRQKADEAKGDIIVWIDPHYSPIDKNWLKQLVAPFNDPAVGAVTGNFTPKKRKTMKCSPGGMMENAASVLPVYKHNKLTEVDILTLQCDAIKADILLDSGAAQRHKVPPQAEHVELSLRISHRDYKIFYQPDAVVQPCRKKIETVQPLARILSSALESGAADAFLTGKWQVDWLHSRFFMVAILTVLLPLIAVVSIPYAAIGAGLVFLWGWFTGFRLPLIPWEWPLATVNLAVYLAIIFIIRDDWAAGIFPPRTWHPSIIRQLMFVISVPLSYLLITVATAGKTALKSVTGIKCLHYLPIVIFLSALWHILSGIGYAKEKMLGKYKTSPTGS